MAEASARWERTAEASVVEEWDACPFSAAFPFSVYDDAYDALPFDTDAGGGVRLEMPFRP